MGRKHSALISKMNPQRWKEMIAEMEGGRQPQRWREVANASV